MNEKDSITFIWFRVKHTTFSGYVVLRAPIERDLVDEDWTLRTYGELGITLDSDGNTLSIPPENIAAVITPQVKYDFSDE